MATSRSKEAISSLVKDGTLQLKGGLDPYYAGIVISADTLMVPDGMESKLRVHSRHNGNLVTTSHQLEDRPVGICLISNTEVAVCLYNSTIEILSYESTDRIRRVKRLHVTTGFYGCDAVTKVESMDKLIVSGWKWEDGSLYWCIVSLTDGHVDTIRKICKLGFGGIDSHLAIKNNTVYISCYAGDDSPNTGVYSYSTPNPNSRKFVYHHSDLKEPKGLTVDTRGYIFVCNMSYPYSIHQLTDRGELVIIHRLSSGPLDIFYEEQDGVLYITCYRSNAITRYRLEYSHQQDPIIPAEVLKMDTRSLHMYKDALRYGKEQIYSVRVMVVGQYGVGKTTLTKRLLGKDVKISDSDSTEGIDVHTECCKVSLATGEWTRQEKNAEQYSRLQRLVKVLNERVQKQESESEQKGQSVMDNLVATEVQDIRHSQLDQPVSAKRVINQEVTSTFSPAVELPIVHMVPEGSSQIESSENEKDAVMEILHLVNENSDKLEKSTVDYAALALWDFAGQYVFYTTHQTFLTSRAIYLLVIDLSQQVTDLIKDDECFLDTEGIKLCKVHDLIEIWLNSIHSCAPSPQDGIPPVILVGTHVDKIPEKFRQKVIDKYFMKLRDMLKDKPVRFHLMDDFAIDNTQYDPRLEELKRRIFELASEQTYWGEERPARWLPLEQAIMKLKASGVKVATLSDVEKINRSGSVKVEDKDELDLFLRFQHEMGMILYFSVEGLREKIVLDPQWLINALKSLITSEMFIRKNPAIISKWFDFRDKGILTQELIDAIWTKEKNPELHANKEHILLIMEQLNIIAKPRSFSEIGEKEESYYLAPCMLRREMPKEIISPESDAQIENTSVLCFVCTVKFLPPPIFHRLVGACLTRWFIAQQNEENLIYCGCCVFYLDHHHRLTLYFRSYAIFARVARMGVTDMSQSSKLCSEARKFIFENLSKIIENLGRSLQFEPHVQCPYSNADSLEGLIALPLLQKNENVACHSHKKSHTLISRDILKFWYEDKGQSVFGDIDAGKESTVPQTGEFAPPERVPSTSRKTGKLHRTVLNQCLPVLMEDLNVRAVTIYIQQKELFDDVTMRDILEQKTTSDMILELIKLIKQRDQNTYEQFKECLVLAKQADLKEMLEKEEAKVAEKIKETHEAQAPAAHELKTRQQTPVAPTIIVRTTQSPNVQASLTKASTTATSTTKTGATPVPTTLVQTTESSKILTSTTKASTTATSTTKALTTTAPTTKAQTTQSPTVQTAKTKASATAVSETKAIATTAPTTTTETAQSPKVQTSTTKASATAISTTKALKTTAPTIKIQTAQSPKVQTPTTKASTAASSMSKPLATAALTTTAQTAQSPKVQISTTKTSTTAASITKTLTTAVPTTTAQTAQSSKVKTSTSKASTTTSTTKALTTTAPTTKAQTAQSPKVQTTTKATTAAASMKTPLATAAPKTTAQPDESPKIKTSTTKASTTAISTTKAAATTAPTTLTQTTESPKVQTSTTKTSTTAASKTKAVVTTAPTTTVETAQSPKVQTSTTKASTITSTTKQ